MSLDDRLTHMSDCAVWYVDDPDDEVECTCSLAESELTERELFDGEPDDYGNSPVRS